MRAPDFADQVRAMRAQAEAAARGNARRRIGGAAPAWTRSARRCSRRLPARSMARSGGAFSRAVRATRPTWPPRRRSYQHPAPAGWSSPKPRGARAAGAPELPGDRGRAGHRDHRPARAARAGDVREAARTAEPGQRRAREPGHAHARSVVDAEPEAGRCARRAQAPVRSARDRGGGDGPAVRRRARVPDPADRAGRGPRRVHGGPAQRHEREGFAPATRRRCTRCST
jgi:hypothetical protein